MYPSTHERRVRERPRPLVFPDRHRRHGHLGREFLGDQDDPRPGARGGAAVRALPVDDAAWPRTDRMAVSRAPAPVAAPSARRAALHGRRTHRTYRARWHRHLGPEPFDAVLKLA